MIVILNKNSYEESNCEIEKCKGKWRGSLNYVWVLNSLIILLVLLSIGSMAKNSGRMINEVIR